MIPKKLCILSILFFFNSIIIQAQPTLRWADFFVNVRGGYGFIASHKSYTKLLMDRHFTTSEISISKYTGTNSNWGKLYNHPEFGLAYWHSSLGKSIYFKQANGLFSYINFPLNRKPRTIIQFIRGGVGIGYVSSPFDLTTNYKNIMIGSKINICANVMYEIHIPINKLNITTGLSLTHFSNTAIKMPNLGINIPTIVVGVKFNNTKKLINKDSIKKNTYTNTCITAAAGFSDFTINSDKIYPYYTVNMGHYFPIGEKSELEFGCDLSYNSNSKKSLTLKEIPYLNELQLIKPGIHASHILVMSKFSFLFQTGVYLYAKDKKDGIIYNRVGWRINTGKNWFISIALKTHFAKAECLEWGIGYKFKQEK